MLMTLSRWHEEGDGVLLAAIVMPDHLHILFKLGIRLDVGRCVSRWKTEGCKESGYLGAWQRDFWEHRLGNDETWEDYGLYIFLNPFRAGLMARQKVWHGWHSPKTKLKK